VTQPVNPDRTSAAAPNRERAATRQPGTRDAAGASAAPRSESGDTVHLAAGVMPSKDILAARASGQISTMEDAARLASRLSQQMRDEPSAALLAFGATRGVAVRSLLVTA
jgi:hypothetical protein